MKIALGILWSLLCLVVGLLPEAMLWACYHVISPTSEIAKVVLGLGLGYFGIGVCLFVGILMFALWITGLAALADS